MNKAGSRAAASRKSRNTAEKSSDAGLSRAEPMETNRRAGLIAVAAERVQKIKNHRQGIAGGFGGLA
jgi:hypothetical protein